MFMAMIHDVVPEGRVEGVVVDRSQACTLTTTDDTWITTTLETLDALDDDEQCFLPAGTEIEYLHASHEMISQRRLTMDGGGPCAGIGTLDVEAYVWMPSFTGLCDPVDMAASDGVTVLLDGVPTTVDEQGRFAFESVAPGPHMIDVVTDGSYTETSVPVDVDVYPGARVVIALDPGQGPAGTTGDDGGGSDDGSSTTVSSAGSDGGGDDDAGDAWPTTKGADDTSGTGLPPGFAPDDPSGCGCRTRAPAGVPLLLMPILVVLRRRARAD
jgi:hypothetical protein